MNNISDLRICNRYELIGTNWRVFVDPVKLM